MITYKIENDIGFVQLNRPEVYNALLPEMMQELLRLVADFQQQKLVKAIVLGGNGKSFCAGADIHWMKASATSGNEQNLKDSRLLAELFQHIHDSVKPVIAAVHGPVYGGGIGIMAACDIVVAEKSSRFKFSEVRLGITPSTIMPHIVRRMGPQKAKVKVLTAELFDAKEALRCGLVDYLVKENAAEFALSLANDVLKGSPDAHIETKRLLANISGENTNEVFETSIQSLVRIKKTTNAVEGLNAFIEKRKPQWKG